MEKRVSSESPIGTQYDVAYISDGIARITAFTEGANEQSLLSRYDIVPAAVGAVDVQTSDGADGTRWRRG